MCGVREQERGRGMVRKISDALWNLSVCHYLHGVHLLVNIILCKSVVQ